MSSGRRPNPTTRRVPVPDTDSEADGNSPPKRARARATELSEEEKERNAARMLMADLGSTRRSDITAVDKGRPQPVNLTKLLQGRDCELPGSDAGKLAAENKAQLSNWFNFGSTADAKGTANEQLDNIANGQSHRQAMAERLLQEGVLTLEDSYDERVRHKPGPAPLPLKDYRPLDPAVIAGERDSRYGRGGLQATKSKSSARNKPSVVLDDFTVRVTRPSTAGRGLQKRPWPPKGLEHLTAAPPLADPNSFMAAVTKTLPNLKGPSKPAATRPTIKGASAPSMTTRGVSVAVKATGEERVIAKPFENRSRDPGIPPDDFTEAKSADGLLISPYLEGEGVETMSAPVGLGILGFEPKPGPPLSNQTANKIHLDADPIRNFLEKEEIDGLVKYLKQALGMKPGDSVQESAPPAPLQCQKVNPIANSDSKTALARAPPSPEWTKSLNDSIWALPGSKPKSTSGRAPLQTITNHGNDSGIFKSHPTSMGGGMVTAGSPRRSATEAESTTVFGDVTALYRLPGVELVGSRGLRAVKAEEDKTSKTRIKRIAPGPGYEALVREIEQAKKQSEAEKAMETLSLSRSPVRQTVKTPNLNQSPVGETLKTPNLNQSPVGETLKTTTNLNQSPVTQALKYANSVAKGLGFGGWRGPVDSDSSDDWKL
ncbi:hypothetical protein DV735_g407, partial [Chaetothyriales sp. CBS 134920]